MINVSKMRQRTAGFTITELVVATAVFSGVLLLAIVGFIQVGRLFYKGVSVSQTRQVASNIMDAVTADIRLSTAVTWGPGYHPDASHGYLNYCIGSHLYTWINNNPVDLSNHDLITNFGLLQSDVPPGGCPKSVNLNDMKAANPTEMLGNQMQIADFEVNQTSCSKAGTSCEYQVIVTVAYGDPSAFTPQTRNSANPVCQGINTGSQFCSVVKLTSTASNQPAQGQ